MRVRLLCLIIPLLIFKMALAQEQYPNVIPPDPVSAEFQKYLGYPVSHATGLPQINIPLYTMNTSGASLPFSLSYHASGIKVEQQMGHIGLGWSLFPGCKISRNIMGKPDDRYPTNDIRDLQGDFSQYIIETPNKLPEPYFEYLYNITPHDMNDPMFPTEIPNTPGFKDTQHDIFTLHLPNRNITFIVEWINGNIQATTIPESPIKIDFVGLETDGTFDSFEVTDENGIVYNFSGETGYRESNLTHDSAITSWMLKTINPPGANNSITFNYTTFNKNEIVRNLSVINFVDEISVDDGTVTSSKFLEPESSIEMNYPDDYNVATLNNIIYETGESIDFTYSTDSGYMYDILDNITFKNKNAKVVKTVDFERTGKQLTKLTVSGEGAYEFVYDTQSVDPPAGEYTGSDFLGLFNGNYGEATAVPEMYLYYNTHGTSPSYLPRLLGDIDIKSHPIKSQARILKNIIYPTGGQTSFEYEPNIYQTYEGIVSGMGLRIKAIYTKDPSSGKTLTKSYKYGQNEDGIGHCNIPNFDISTGQGPTNYTSPYVDAYINQSYVAGIVNSRRIRSISSTAKTGLISDPVIWYDEVVEYSYEGKTIFNYEFTPTQYYPYRDKPEVLEGLAEYTIPVSFFPTVLRNIGNSTPRLVKQEIQDSNANTLQVIEHEYSNILDTRRIDCIYARPLASVDYSILRTVPHTPNGILVYLAGNNSRKLLTANEYQLEINNQKLISTTQRDYRNGTEIVTETDYDYDDTYRFNLRSKTVNTSDNGILKEQYYYPTDGSNIPDWNTLTADQKSMVNTFAANKNYQGRVIEKEIYKNTTLLSKELYGYKNWGNSIYQIENTYSKKNMASSFFSPFTITSYNEIGNIEDILKLNGTYMSYIWGYNKQYPLAKIDNITPAQKTNLQSLINTAIGDSNDDINATTENNLRASLNEIRTSSILENAMVSTYTYNPLIGVTSSTDPKGNTMYYNYNTDNKLESVKDYTGKLLQEYEYNYVPFGTNDPEPVPVYSGDINSGGGETLLDKPSYMLNFNSHDFGQKSIGSSNTFTFTITNTTPATYTINYFTIDSIDLPDGFVLVSKPLNVYRGTPASIVIAFEPTAQTNYTGTAVLSVNGSTSIGSHISLSGQGIPNNDNGILEITENYNNAPAINILDFGSLSQNDYITKTIRIHNRSNNSPLTISNVTQSNILLFYNNIQAPIIIQANSFIDYDIDFIGGNFGGIGTVNETITFDSSDNSSNNVLQLKGNVTQ